MLFSFLVNLILSVILQNIDLQKGVDNFDFGQTFSLARIINLDVYKEPMAKELKNLDIDLTAKSAVVVDANTGKILFNKNAEEIVPIASITKLMTGLVFLDNNPGWYKLITMQEKDEMNGDKPDIERGETVSVNDLFYTSLISSDNNATAALARLTGLGTQGFIDGMNQKAADLHLTNTTFVEPTGLKEQNQSTALDLAHLAYHAFSNDSIQKVTSMQDYLIDIVNTGEARRIYSTDILLGSDSLKVKAGKTGYLDEAGGCLVVQAENEAGNDIIVVVLGSKDQDTRFEEIQAIIEWTFNSYEWPE